MPQPAPYSRQFDFTDFSASEPASQQPGQKLDAEFDGIKQTLDDALRNMALIQRDDGALANEAVGIDQLSPELQVVVGGGTFRIRSEGWAPGLTFATGDIFADGGLVYIAIVDHVAEDLIADTAARRVVPAFGARQSFASLTGSFKDNAELSSAISARLGVASSRAELAALPFVAGQSHHFDGFMWTARGGNYAALVAADPRAGIYLAPAAGSGVAVDGSQGAWERQFSGPVEVRWFAPDGVDDTPAIHAARDMAATLGVNHVRVSSPLACTTQVTFDKDDQTWDFLATVSNSSALGNSFYFTGNRMTFNDPKLALTSEAATSNFRNVGDGNTFHNPTFTRAASAGVPFYQYGTNCIIRLGSSSWYGPIFCNGVSGFKMVAHELTNIGGDDSMVFKATTASTDGFMVALCTFNGGGSICAFGSEIGLVGVNDPDKTRFVRNGRIIGNTANGAANLLYFKPGAVPAYDYRGGLVENIVVSDNTLNDPAGALFNRAIALTAARGSTIRNITGKNNRVRARCLASGVTLAACLHVKVLDFRAISGAGNVPAPDSLPSTISGIDVQVFYDDPYNGVPAGGAAPGAPASNIVLIEKDTAGWGSISDITVDVTANGCSSNGIVIGADLDDAVYIRRATLTNVCKDGSNGLGGIAYSSRVKVGDEISIAVAAGSAAKAYKPQAGGSLVSKMEIVALKDIAAATVGNRAIRWAAPRNCFVHKVEIVNFLQVNKSPDDVNFIQHEIRNENGVGANLFIHNKLTGGVVMTASQFNTIFDAANLSASQLADCHYALGNRMSYTKNSGGTGYGITDAYLRIHWAPR